jgi:NADH-quinone oxidoreductase subunit L
VLALIPLLPLGGFLVNAFAGKRLPKSISGGLATIVMALAFVISVMQVLALAAMPATSRQINQLLFNWMSAGDFSIDLALRLDSLSAVMILVITGIGSLIHLYSTS